MTSVKPPELYWTAIFSWTEEPNKSPSLVAFCNCGNVIDTFIASTFVFVTCLVTGESTVTVTPTGVIDWLVSIPGILVWLDVPKRETKEIFWWKLDGRFEAIDREHLS